ncbi:MAG: efflux RND transporter periplasmic adaptor subunit [Bacteriovoracaceae bacterium]|nr:efflux RND transporter periplasmic adaptor subunit [Bacteroidota bacterium]
MQKNTRIILIVAAVLLLLLLAASPRLGLFKSTVKVEQRQSDQRLPVAARIVRPAPFENNINSTGTILANEEVEIRSEISGQIIKITFDEGSNVKKGDLLVKINDDELRAQLLKQESQKSLANDIFKRRKQLYEGNLISSEDYDKAKNDLKSIEAEIQLIRARIGKTELRAPFDGGIGLRYVSEGSFVNSSTRIATLQNLSSVKLDFSIPEKYATVVTKGSAVSFTTSSSSDRFIGTIFAIEPKIDPITRTVQIRARAANVQGKLVPGAFAQVQLLLEKIPGAIMIPSEAVIPEMQGQKVFVVVNGKAQSKKVVTGLRTENLIQITSGLEPGDTVIITGVMQLRPASSITLTEVL